MRLLLASVALTFIGCLLTAPAALSQTPGAASTAPTSDDTSPPYLTLDQASPWVAPNGTWTATWTVANEPPADAVLQYTIHQPLGGTNLRGALAQVIAGGGLGPSLHNQESTSFAALRSGSKATLTIAIRDHSGPAEQFLVPNPGILPIDVDLATADGSRLQHTVLFLDRLPAAASHPALRVAPRAEVTSAPIVQPDGTSTIPAAARQSIDSLVGLLRHQPSVPITSTIDPELLAGLKRSSDPADGTRLSQFRNALDTRPVLRSSWAPLDLESWATSGAVADLQASLFAGQSVISGQTGAATENRVWPPDPTIGPGATRQLGEVGVQHLILSPSQLETTKDLGSDPGTTRRVEIESADGLDALVDDPTMTAQLANTKVTPGMSAHLLATELESIWFSTPTGVTPAVTLDLSSAAPGTAADVLDDLAVTPNPTLTVTSVQDAFNSASAYQVTSRRKSTPMVRKLVAPAGTRNIAPLSVYLGRLRQRAAAYHSTMADPTGVAPLDDLLLVSQHRSLSSAGDRRYLDAAARRIDGDLSKIQPPPGRSLTLTARTTLLPVHIVNGVDRPVAVLLRFRGTRLGLAGGATRAVRLQPGQNSLTVPVVVRTSGEFTMTVEIRTADNSLLLSESTVRIRSTVVSGVGVLLGGGALLFLVIWWGATIRRDRRARAAAVATVTSPADEPASVA